MTNRYPYMIGRTTAGVKPGDNVVHRITSNGDTMDIVQVVMDADKKCGPYILKQTAAKLMGNSLRDTSRNIWNFVRANVSYKEDGTVVENGKRYSVQNVKSPGNLFRTGIGDCKSMSIACAAVLQNLGILYCYRFVSEDKNRDYHHVYIIVDPHGEKIPLDCVWPRFGVEPSPIAKKMDKAGMNGGAAVAGHSYTAVSHLKSNNYYSVGSHQTSGISATAKIILAILGIHLLTQS